MANLKVSKRHIITLWHETQMGQMKKCNEAQAEFAELMWKLYDELDWKKDMQPEVFDKKIVNLEPILKRILEPDECDKYHEEQDIIAMKQGENQ